MNFKEKLEQFLNSMIAKGIPVAKVDAARAFYTANPELIQPTAEGVLAQDELSRRSAELDTLTQQIRSKHTEWTTYLDKANQTLSLAEREKSAATARAAAAETAIKALAQQYNIPEDDVRAIYNPTPSSDPNANRNLPSNVEELLRLASTANRNQDPNNLNRNQNQITRDDLVGLIDDMGKKDAIAARHFELTGKPWNSSKALDYIKEQATLGREVQLEAAWRVTENVDSLEAAAQLVAKKAEREQIEREVRDKIAAEQHTPVDATPQFGEAVISKIFEQSADNNDPNAKKERTGHYGRTQEAVAALGRLHAARARGEKSPYEPSPSGS